MFLLNILTYVLRHFFVSVDLSFWLAARGPCSSAGWLLKAQRGPGAALGATKP